MNLFDIYNKLFMYVYNILDWWAGFRISFLIFLFTTLQMTGTMERRYRTIFKTFIGFFKDKGYRSIAITKPIIFKTVTLWKFYQTFRSKQFGEVCYFDIRNLVAEFFFNLIGIPNLVLHYKCLLSIKPYWPKFPFYKEKANWSNYINTLLFLYPSLCIWLN